MEQERASKLMVLLVSVNVWLLENTVRKKTNSTPSQQEPAGASHLTI